MTFYDIKTSILPILKRQGVLKAALFGSFARNEGGKNSDIDILVKLDKNKTLHMNVDVLTYDSINHLLKSRIMKEQRVIYEQRS